MDRKISSKNDGRYDRHEEKINTLKNLIQKQELPHLLFYGPPGTEN